MRPKIHRAIARENDDFALRQIILEHLFDKLARQHDYVISLRNQAGISAAVAGIIATFFGTIIGSNTDLLEGEFLLGMDLYALIALLLFSCSIGCSVAVVVHFVEFTNSFDTKKMLDAASNSKMLFFQSYFNDGEWYFNDNEKKISATQSKLWFAMIFAFMQIIPWTVVVNGAIDVR